MFFCGEREDDLSPHEGLSPAEMPEAGPFSCAVARLSAARDRGCREMSVLQA